MRKLTLKEIEKLSNRKGVRKIAVENFLFSMGEDGRTALSNLYLDASLYKWNSATINAIQKGIRIAQFE